MNLKLISALAAGLMMSAQTFAATTLDFEGTNNGIENFYSSQGITFGGAAWSFDNASVDGVVPFFSDPLLGARVMSATDADATMNVANGFAGTLSFQYAALENTSIRLYSGLDGTGDLISTIDLEANTAGCTTSTLCLWNLVTLDFAGVAQSITFGDSAGAAAFDNVSVSAVPLPAAAWLLISGLGGLGVFSRRKRAA